jgi:hypothetical protein
MLNKCKKDREERERREENRRGERIGEERGESYPATSWYDAACSSYYFYDLSQVNVC